MSVVDKPVAIETNALPAAIAALPFANRMAAILPKLSRYTLVSVAALVLDFAVYMVLVQLTEMPTLAGVIGYTLGLGLHYSLSVRFVFDIMATDKSIRRTFVEFVVSGLVGLCLTALVIWLATTVVGLPALIAKVLAVGISFLAVFAMRHAVVFAPLR